MNNNKQYIVCIRMEQNNTLVNVMTRILPRCPYKNFNYHRFSGFVVAFMKNDADFSKTFRVLLKHFKSNMIMLRIRGNVITVYVNIRFGQGLDNPMDVAERIIQNIIIEAQTTIQQDLPSDNATDIQKVKYSTARAIKLSEDGEYKLIELPCNYGYIPLQYKIVFGKIPKWCEKYFQKPL